MNNHETPQATRTESDKSKAKDQTPFYKKATVTMASLALAAGMLAGCSNTEAQPEPTPIETTQTPTPEPTPVETNKLSFEDLEPIRDWHIDERLTNADLSSTLSEEEKLIVSDEFFAKNNPDVDFSFQPDDIDKTIEQTMVKLNTLGELYLDKGAEIKLNIPRKPVARYLASTVFMKDTNDNKPKEDFFSYLDMVNRIIYDPELFDEESIELRNEFQLEKIVKRSTKIEDWKDEDGVEWNGFFALVIVQKTNPDSTEPEKSRSLILVVAEDQEKDRFYIRNMFADENRYIRFNKDEEKRMSFDIVDEYTSSKQ